MKMLDKERTGGHRAVSVKPKGRGKGEELVVGCEISLEVGLGVNDKIMVLCDDSVAFKELVGFVTGQEETIIIIR